MTDGAIKIQQDKSEEKNQKKGKEKKEGVMERGEKMRKKKS